MGGYVSSVELLLAHNAQVNAKDRDGFTPLHRAAFAGGMSERANFSGVVEVLLAHGADVNAKDITNDTPLHSAAAGGYENVVDRVNLVKVLLAHGADIYARNKDGRTPYDLATGGAVVELLRRAEECNTPRGGPNQEPSRC